MSEVGAADRERLLRSKRAQLSGIVTSRKRKLREFYAVCDNDAPIPQIDPSNPDAPPSSVAEAHFLDVTDILQDRLFDESNLPTRRQLRSSTSKQRSPIRKVSPEARSNDAIRKAAKQQRDRSRPRKSRASTPGTKNDGGRQAVPFPNRSQTIAVEIPPMQHIPVQKSSKSSQTETPVSAPAVEKLIDQIVDKTIDNATQPQISAPETSSSIPNSENERIRMVVESRHNSPGVNPQNAMPLLPEDAAQLPGPVLFGAGNPQHKAATVHLPPKEAQEERLEQVEKVEKRKEEAAQLKIDLPSRDAGKIMEPLSSPGSTIDAQSATTPALHEASTDTSPENDSSRYDAEGMEDSGDKDEEPSTPPELRLSAEEVAAKEEHDRILKAEMDIARAEIMRSSPTAAETQLLEEQAAVAPQAPRDLEESPEEELAQKGFGDSRGENKAAFGDEESAGSQIVEEATKLVEDVVADEGKLSNGPVSEDIVMSDAESSKVPPASTGPDAATPTEQKGKEREIVDSEAEDQTPTEQAPSSSVMDLDRTTVQDSFESNGTKEGSALKSPDTQARPQLPSQLSESSGISQTGTPKRSLSTPTVVTPVIERMTTRVSSGALRQKSVSEILGETPKPSGLSTSERSISKGTSDSARTSNSPSRSTTPQTPGARVRSAAERAKEKERSKLSTVIFAKPQPKPPSQNLAVMQNGAPASPPAKDDYFMPLFLATSSTDKRGVPSLDNLLATAHKTITTDNAYVPINENQTAKVLKRIYNLQSSGKWSLRQPKRSPEAIRPTSHWDLVIQEAKWLRTDFRGEKKWKISAARNLAFACAEWVEASPEDRKLLQVNAIIPKQLQAQPDSSRDHDMGEGSSQAGGHPTPDLVASEHGSPMDDFDEEPRFNLMETVAPTAIFGLTNDDIVFALRRSPTADKLLDELPLYGQPLTVPPEIPDASNDPDRYWKRPALPLSKYVEGRMELKVEGPPRKKSRFAYENDDDEEDQVIFGQTPAKRTILPPETTNVALFDPDHKHIRDRIHSSHQFRPPSEFVMPNQSFFECRTPSQWTWDEENELKTLVREYSYNWSLISSMLASKSIYSSGPERRTPWECFERWIYMEGLPADMQKTHYFRAYTQRIDAANRNLMAQSAQAAQQPNSNGQLQQISRKRTTAGIRVERRRNQKHIMMVDAMRKLAKKRETNLQKQQHTAGMAALRKANEAPSQPRAMAAHTPQDFSRMKQEREEQMKERVAAFQLRQEAQRRNAQAQRAAAQGAQQGLPTGLPQNRPNPGSNIVTNGTASSGSTLAVPGQNRPRPMPPQMTGQPMPNRLQVPPMNINGVSQAAMQGQLPLPNPTLDIGLVNRAQQVQQHQQIIRQQQQQQGQIAGQSPQMQNSSPRVNGLPQPGFPMQNSMMPPFNTNNNGVSTPPTNSSYISTPGQAGSPRIGQLIQNGIPAGMSQSQIMDYSTMRAQNPNATQEQIMQAIKRMPNYTQSVQSRQAINSAMSAAAGGNVMASMNGMVGSGGSTPQMYAHLLRQQQENQQKQQMAQQAANSVGVQAQAQTNGMGNAGQGHAQRPGSGNLQNNK